MDEDAVDAAARAISFLGEAALRASAADLVTRARSVALAAAGANAADLAAAATALDLADRAGRRQAVSGLLGAATVLDAALGVGLDRLRGAAADLARQCGDHREAAKAVEEVRRAAEERNLQREVQPARPWWWLLFRWKGRGRRSGGPRDMEEGLLAKGPPAEQAPGIMDAARKAVHFLRNEAARSDDLVELASKIVLSARGLAVSYESLVAARDALQQADSPSRVNTAVIDLEAAATDLKEAASAELVTVRSPAVQLAAACRVYLEAAQAMETVRSATKEKRERAAAAAALVENEPEPAACLPQGDGRRFAMAGFALYGSITLFTYLGPNVVAEKVHKLTDNIRCLIFGLLSVWWALIASGVPCGAYTRSLLEIRFVQIICRVGTTGITVLVILFLYLSLDINEMWLLLGLIVFAVGVHGLSFSLTCSRRGDMS